MWSRKFASRKGALYRLESQIFEGSFFRYTSRARRLLQYRADIGPYFTRFIS